MKLTLGQRLRKARETAKLSRSDVMGVVGKKSTTTIKNWEEDRHNPGEGDLMLISKATSTSYAWLRDGVGDMGDNGEGKPPPHNHVSTKHLQPDSQNHHSETSQIDQSLAGDGDEGKGAIHNPKKQEGAMQVSDEGVGVSRIYVPEWIVIKAFKQVLLRVHISTVVPGMQHVVDISQGITGLVTGYEDPQEGEESPGQEKQDPPEPEG